MSKQRERDSFHEVSEARSKPLSLSIEWKVNRGEPFPLFFPPRASLVGKEQATGVVRARKGGGGEGIEDFPLYHAEKVDLPPEQGRYLKVQRQHRMGGEMLVESIPYDEHGVNCDVRIPESLYNFLLDTKQVFVENHLVNIVHLNVRKRIGTISYIEPAIDECTLNVMNASVTCLKDRLSFLQHYLTDFGFVNRGKYLFYFHCLEDNICNLLCFISLNGCTNAT